ncbi:MAG: hypothetical protein U9P38_01750 [Campylobacterota bacterium]|nr:hypothetical protein [Campylobacterota bacterium]
MKSITKLLAIFFTVLLFVACSDSDTPTYNYQPVGEVTEESSEEECVPVLVGEDDGDGGGDDSGDGEAGSGGATSDPAMPDDGNDDDDEEGNDGAAVNTAPIAYTQLGTINVTVDCLIYPLITAISSERSTQVVPPTSTLRRMQTPRMPSPYSGQYKIEMGAYAIREERIYLNEGSLIFSFMMPDNEVNGFYKLVTPPNRSGTVQITYIEDQNNGFKMEGKMIGAEIYTNEDQNETYKLSLDFSTTILTQPTQ